MINYTEKGMGLHDAIRAAGHWLREENGVWVSSDDAIVQAIIDSFDPVVQQQESIWNAIKVERDRRQELGVVVNGLRFHSDEKSRIQQLGLVMMGENIPQGLQWKTMDGTFVTMTQALAQQIFAATAAYDQAVFAVAEAHKASAFALPNPAEYDYSLGWPG